MKKLFLFLISSIARVTIGFQLPKENNIGYVIISSRITNSEQAGKYFPEVNNVVVK